jgi:hypothetical protein
MPSRESLAYRRSAQINAKKASDSRDGTLDTIYGRASNDFHTFCTILDKTPARHMLEWHHHLITGESNKYLLDIAGQNLDILAPRGSAKSTVFELVYSLDNWAAHYGLRDHFKLFIVLTTSLQQFLRVELLSRSSTLLSTAKSSHA